MAPVVADTLGARLGDHGANVLQQFPGVVDHTVFDGVTNATHPGRLIIGRITRHRLFMKYFGADGKWWARPCGIDYWEISRVAFGGEYEVGWEGYFRDRKES